MTYTRRLGKQFRVSGVLHEKAEKQADDVLRTAN